MSSSKCEGMCLARLEFPPLFLARLVLSPEFCLTQNLYVVDAFSSMFGSTQMYVCVQIWTSQYAPLARLIIHATYCVQTFLFFNSDRQQSMSQLVTRIYDLTTCNQQKLLQVVSIPRLPSWPLVDARRNATGVIQKAKQCRKENTYFGV